MSSVASMSPAVAQAAAQAFLSNPGAAAAPVSQQDAAKQAAQSFQQREASSAPLPSQQQLEDDYNKKEFALEDQLRAQDEAAAQPGANDVPAAATQPMQSDNPAVITTPQQAAEHEATTASAAHADIETNAANARNLEMAKAKTQASIAHDSQGAQDALAKDIQLRHDHLAQVQAQVEQQQQTAINNYQSVNDEMLKMAQAQPKDIYGAAGVNSILGRIAVFLGGAGSNGFGDNHNLDYIQRMAANNVQQQQQRYEFLNKVGEGQRTLYGMLNTRLGNAFQVDKTLMNMGLEVAKANIQSVSNKYADQTTRQAAQEQINKINELQAKNNYDVEQQVSSDTQKNLANYAQMQASQVAAYAAQMKAKASQQGVPIAGFVGGVPKEEHARLAKMVGGARTLIDALSGMGKKLQDGKIANNFDAIREFFVNDAELLKGARDFLETGTRIEAGEQSTMQSFQVMPAEGIANIMLQYLGLKNTDIAGIRAKIEEGKRVVTAATYQTVKAAAPRMATLDSHDPLFARYDPRRAKGLDILNRFAAAKRSNIDLTASERSRGILRDAPKYYVGAPQEPTD